MHGVTHRHNVHLEDWQTWTLGILNLTTLLITIVNFIYLCKKMPKARQSPKYAEAQLKHISSVPVLQRQKSVSSFILSIWRTRVVYYFYIMPLIPLLVSYAAHYGAQYPPHSIWIFPALDIVIAVAFLAFMHMMIISCDGMNVIRFYLESKEDVPKYKCCKKPNAFIGFRSRFKYAYLIMLKPFFDYAFSYFQYFYGTPQFQTGLRVTLKLLILTCNVAPVKGIQMFHEQCYKLSRMKRTNAKTNFVVCFAPGIQIQQLLFAILFDVDAIPGFYNVEEKFRWSCLYGMVLCFEMVFFSLFVTFVFHPTDLLLWDDTDISLVDRGNAKESYSTSVKTPSTNGSEL